MFLVIIIVLVIGVVVECGRMFLCVIFMFLWFIVVYDVVVCWIWNLLGWFNKMGGLDFVGGILVYIVFGVVVLVYSMMFGKRRGYGIYELNYWLYNVMYIVIGIVFLWVGWFGFNVGFVLVVNMRVIMVVVVINLSVCVGGIMWCVLDYRLERKWLMVGFCLGVVVGLVVIMFGFGRFFLFILFFCEVVVNNINRLCFSLGCCIMWYYGCFFC